MEETQRSDLKEMADTKVEIDELKEQLNDQIK